MANKLITDKNEIEKLLQDYFVEIKHTKGALAELLKNYAKKEGYAISEKEIFFEGDLDESDEAYQVLKDRPLVLLDISAQTSSAEEDSEAYLSFDELYLYLKKEVERTIENDISRQKGLLVLLDKVREALIDEE
ncbi:hypothetical protein [Listeria ilorinensis]|uniref:hypothetical protein n=1 Tax=Listeria ilorinensis TaxID=2867439 RepID=UPI001EF3DED3|nr:hypothetical protein [Listeria ilorinensis]